MRKAMHLIPVLALAALLTGCNEPQPDPLARLTRANQELQRQIESEERILKVMSMALVILGGALAVSLGALWRKGGAPSNATTQL